MGWRAARAAGKRHEPFLSPSTHARDQGCRFHLQTQQSDPRLQIHPLLKPRGNTALAAAIEAAAKGKALLGLALQRAGNNTLLIGKQTLGQNCFLGSQDEEHEGAP